MRKSKAEVEIQFFEVQRRKGKRDEMNQEKYSWRKVFVNLVESDFRNNSGWKGGKPISPAGAMKP